MRISDWSSDVCSSDLIILARIAAVEPPDGEAAVAQQLLVETARRDAQVGAFEIGFGKAGEARKLTADLRAFLALQFLALEQRGGIGADRPLPGFLDERLARWRRRLAMIDRGCGNRRQVGDRRQLVARRVDRKSTRLNSSP